MWSFFVICILFLQSSCYKANVYNCTRIGTELWRQVWHSEFNNKTELTKLWNIEHEEVICSRNGIEQANCNVRDNVQVMNGYAFLVAKHEKHSGMEYTAATMTTNAAFTYGRFEIRARLPHGDFLRPSIFTRNDSELYWHDLGQFDMGSYGQDAALYRGIHYAHSTNKYQPVDLPFSSVSSAVIKLGEEFHLYGIEWSAEDVRFFWDNTYSKWFNFTRDTPFTPWHHIRLQIGVGGITFPRKMPANFSELNWVCPALIVDYVRIYERLHDFDTCRYVTAQNNAADSLAETNQVNKLCKTFQSEPIKKIVDNEIPEKIVASFQMTQWIIAIMVILFAIAIFWMMIQLRSVRRKLDNEHTNNNDPLNGFNNAYSMPEMGKGMEDETYEMIDNYQFDVDGDRTRYVPYLPLEEIYKQNEYLQVHNASPNLTPHTTPPPSAPNSIDFLDKVNRPKSIENVYTPQNELANNPLAAQNSDHPSAHYDVLRPPKPSMTNL